jgi:uncharacterized linocin/CFP29 family protein
MDLLKRELAPILPDAWGLIDNEARRVLKLNLAGRKLVDFEGPFGWEYAAVNIGRLEMFSDEPLPGLRVGRRLVQPLIEMRMPIRLDIAELDSVARGADDPDLAPVIDAAEKIAHAEDSAIFYGYEQAGIAGMITASPHAPMELPAEGKNYPQAIVEAKEVLRAAGIGGPYGLALGPKAYDELTQATDDGYPVRKRIEQQIIAGPIVWAPSLDGAVLLTTRGGDYQLTVGQDLSVGYAGYERGAVDLFIVESFTFRVLEPAAAIYLRHGENRREG